MKNKIILLLIGFLATITFDGCRDNENFDNKPTYKIKVGETITYFVSYNSCCFNCWLNKNSMTTLKLVEEKEVKAAPEDCDGCTSWYAFVFKAIKPGQDTLKHFSISPVDSCSYSLLDSLKEKPKFSIVTVTN